MCVDLIYQQNSGLREIPINLKSSSLQKIYSREFDHERRWMGENGVKVSQDCEMRIIPKCSSNKETLDVKDVEEMYQSKHNNEAMRRNKGRDQFKDFMHQKK